MGKSGFDGINPHIARLAQTLQENGLAASAVDAVSLASSISTEEDAQGAEAYGSEKIPNRHIQERPKREGWMIDNLTPEECGPPVSHLNKERRPGDIENVQMRDESAPCPPEQRPAPESTPAVFLQDALVAAETVNEASSAPEEAPKEEYEHPADDPAVRDILDADAHLIYGPPVVAVEEEEEVTAVQPEEPAEEVTPPQVEQPPVEEPVIEPAEPEPPQREEQSQHSEGTNSSIRGRGLSAEEEEMTDISKLFNYGNK